MRRQREEEDTEEGGGNKLKVGQCGREDERSAEAEHREQQSTCGRPRGCDRFYDPCVLPRFRLTRFADGGCSEFAVVGESSPAR